MSERDRQQLANINRFWLPLCVAALGVNAICVAFVHDWYNWALAAAQLGITAAMLRLRTLLARRIARSVGPDP